MSFPRVASIATGGRLAGVLSLLVLLAAPAAARTAPADSSDALAWARRVIAARQAVAAAEAELDPARQAALAAEAFEATTALAPDDPADGALRDLVLRAHAVYEPHHGAVAAPALSPAEFGRLRADALASMRRPDAEVELRDPAVVAAARAAAHEATLHAAAEAERAAGPAHLFYPADAADLVEDQADVARRFAALRTRMRRHFPHIERTLRRRGLPTELKYVAVIESALNPEAESWAGARGMWQFMPATAAEFGLDEETVTDPAASTDAAARYLRQLGRMFRGDYQLALAAYNAGPGRLLRLVRAHQAATGDYPTFWDLHDDLPHETREYVPRFLAVAELLG